jgi:hypothetical protein
LIDVWFYIPPLRGQAALQCELTAAVVIEGSRVAEHASTIWILADDPFSDRGQWLSSLRLTLFDPPRKTAEVLDRAGIPYELLRSVSQLASLPQRLILVGEETALDESRGLPTSLLQAAARGNRVLCLASKSGCFPDQAVWLNEANRVTLRRADVIYELDERLDTAFWRSQVSSVNSVLRFEPQQGAVIASADKGGWPWCDLRFGQPEGRFVFCGFPLVRCWEHNPTPRYLFARILEQLANAEE